jgi:metastasis-associated protein MTA
MAEGLYRIGECIYMEVYPPPTPYQICKIEELRKNSKGGVEVAVKCFYRRRDLPSQLLALADQHARKSVCLTDRYVTRVRDDGVMFNVNKRTVALPAHLTPQSILCGRKNRNVTFCFVF